MKTISTFSFVLLMILSSYVTFGQEKATRFCRISVTGQYFSSSLKFEIDTGSIAQFNKFRYPSIKNDLLPLIKFRSRIDFLNYMSLKGWTLLNANPPQVNRDSWEHYVFSKVMELIPVKSEE